MPYVLNAPQNAIPNPGAGLFTTAGGITVTLPFVPTVTAGAYSSGNVVGGMQAVPFAVRPQMLTGVLYGVTVLANSNTAPPLTLYFLKNSQQGGIYTDNAAITWNVADFKDIIFHHTIAAADYVTAGSKQVASYGGIGKPLVLPTTTLFVLPVATGSFTPGSTSDYTFLLSILQD